jgi:hypothetical protein
MVLSKFLACAACAITILAAAGCADGTGQALTPTLPTTDTTISPDGNRLKASAPQPVSPLSAVRVTSLTPELFIRNAEASEPSVQLSYVFEVYEGADIVAKSEPVAGGNPQTSWTVPADTLKLNRTYAWTAYAVYSGVRGSVADIVSFRTPTPPPVATGAGPVFCAGNSGPAIVACVAAAFPEKLVATGDGDFSDERRFANMEFLRDRIIETGLCNGLDLGLNRKRGTAVISRDFIVLRSNKGKDGRDRGVDIASGYDAVRTKLKLTWQVFDDGPNYGHPFYKDYGPVDCSAVK